MFANVFRGNALNRSVTQLFDVDVNRFSSTPVFGESPNMTAKNKCFLCAENFKPLSLKDPTLQCVACTYCSEWFCLTCLDPKCTTPAQLSTLLKFLGSEKIEAHCGKCVKPDLKELFMSLKNANIQIEKLTATVTDLQDQVNRSAVYTPAVAGCGGVISADIQQMIVETVARVVPQAMADFWSNYQSREKCKCAIVVAGLTASDTKSDEELVAGDLLPELQVKPSDVSIKSVFRMGKGKKQGDKFLPPLLKIVFEDSDQRNSVLRGAKNLRDSSVLEGVFLRPSLTTQQREVNQKLLHQRFLLKKTGKRMQVRYSGDGDPYLWDTSAKQTVDTSKPLIVSPGNDLSGVASNGVAEAPNTSIFQ